MSGRNSLGNSLCRTSGLYTRFKLPLSARFILLLLLLLIGKRSQRGRRFSYFQIFQGATYVPDMLLDEGGIERLAFVLLQDVLNDERRELCEFILCFGVQLEYRV
jgi:hypothetical protein